MSYFLQIGEIGTGTKGFAGALQYDNTCTGIAHVIGDAFCECSHQGRIQRIAFFRAMERKPANTVLDLFPQYCFHGTKIEGRPEERPSNQQTPGTISAGYAPCGLQFRRQP